MDRYRAERIAKELKGKQVGNWTVHEYINNGKSAVLLKATKNEDVAALKLFDPDLVEAFGKCEQSFIDIHKKFKA